MLPEAVRNKFHEVLRRFDDVFDPKIVGYNDAAGPMEAIVNMSPVEPPQRKGRVPQYSHDKLVGLEAQFDELEQSRVFRWPEDVGITVEHLNRHFL